MTEAIVVAIRDRAGRGPERAKAAFLGEGMMVVELGRLLTTLDRTLVEAGHADVVESQWACLGSTVAKDLATAVGAAVAAEAACTSWVMDAKADMLLLVFSIGPPTAQA